MTDDADDGGFARLQERFDQLEGSKTTDLDWRDFEINVFEAFAHVQEHET